MNSNEFHDQYPRALGRSITYLHRQKMKYMNNKLKDYEIYGAMHMILNNVSRNPGTSQDAIASHLNIDKCTVARRTKRLEELGYLRKETNAEDRRQNNLFVTEKGRQVVPIIRKYLRQWSELISASLSEEEKRTVISLLDKIVESAGKIEEKA